MNLNYKKVLLWTPRVLTIAFAIFLSLFAFDVFSEGYGFGETVLALLIHLIPTGLVIAALVVGWRWPRLGGMFFIILAIAYVVMSRFEIPAVLIIAGPVLVIGILFLVSGILNKTKQV